MFSNKKNVRKLNSMIRKSNFELVTINTSLNLNYNQKLFLKIKARMSDDILLVFN